ncbi:hypothetical protein [Sulfurivermis fontis]|uniref:hypothetical protein n=1 Tax=Sulfurivermis fontis TaxID=1972068 RepID=UPI000FD92EC4|nr:hypothetical protein [Sulfurivermis fontis]
MDRSAIVAKTAKGEEEIQSRKYGLERNLRYVLILIDGKTSVQQLVDEKGAALPDVAGSLRTLAEQGFISIGGVSLGADDETCTVAAEQDIPTLKAALIAIAKEVLGADAGKIVSKLEAAPDSREGLQEAVNSCKKVVRLLIDEKKAEALMARCGTVLKGL